MGRDVPLERAGCGRGPLPNAPLGWNEFSGRFSQVFIWSFLADILAVLAPGTIFWEMPDIMYRRRASCPLTPSTRAPPFYCSSLQSSSGLLTGFSRAPPRRLLLRNGIDPFWKDEHGAEKPAEKPAERPSRRREPELVTRGDVVQIARRRIIPPGISREKLLGGGTSRPREYLFIGAPRHVSARRRSRS